ncbi:helical backbone metal receptor [Lederbergia wuyishanensis]|uniref:Iron complex transport system substrate-binding protein n=1 Tax=Lederbergia wuyishanensis TaxID=1347903 RepID=A0ABU0D3G6_9BACI|nr:ABC transporter substrate-binding protein [Lederbergia wuyishanensis]MCJ8007886.1 ABC transporter substrate-binding protein [Lederbergia wuyishanensis]MDQ0342947.1 iron complex transport system substrate-binding protein [Lederbergia wuyishanensis]
MKKLFGLLAAILLVFGVLAACGKDGNTQNEDNNKQPVSEQGDENTSKAEEAFPVTIKDASDTDVVIEKKPEKIVSLIPSNTEIVYALGEGDAVVGVSELDNYPEEAATKEKVAGMELNVEKILSLNPDLVLAHGSVATLWEAGLKQLKDSGVTVLVVNDAQSFDAVYKSIEMIGEATGKTAESEQLIQDMKAKLDDIQKQAASISEEDQKTVFVEVSPAPEIYTTGKNTFMNEMLEVINAKNTVSDKEGWIPINEEAVVKMNPDAIITTVGYVENAAEQIKERAAWKDITAVKENQVYLVNEDLVSRSGPRIVEGVEELAKAIYPDVFGK